MKNIFKKSHFVIIIPRDEIEIFCQAVGDTLGPGVEIQREPVSLTKIIAKVIYPDGIQPRKFVDLGTRFNELLELQGNEKAVVKE